MRGSARSKSAAILAVAVSILLLPSASPAADPVAVDVAVEAGIWDGTPRRSFGAYPHDFNNDGLQDVLIIPHSTGQLYRNDGGSFTQVSMESFFRTDRHGCAWGDANVDGRPDVYCTVGTHGNLSPKNNDLWLQQADGSFVDGAAQYKVTDPLGRGREATFIDVNHDPFPDLYVTNIFPRSDGKPSPNRLFLNEGGTSFREAPEYGLTKEVGGATRLCVQAADYNNDGWEDLLVCGKKKLLLYRNDNGASFTEVSSQEGVSSAAFKSAELVDLDGDATLDLVGITYRNPVLEVQLRPEGVFQAPVIVRNVPELQAVTSGDVNLDNRPDLYVVRRANAGRNQPDMMLINDGSGTAFSDTVIPQVSAGDGQSVAAIDYDDNGKTDFLVLNGLANIKGPVQLISFP